MKLKLKFFGENQFGDSNLLAIYKDNDMQEPIFALEQDADGKIREDISGLVRLLRDYREEHPYLYHAGFAIKTEGPNPYFLNFFGHTDTLVSLHRARNGIAIGYINEYEGEIDSDFEEITKDLVDAKKNLINAKKGYTPPIFLTLEKQLEKENQTPLSTKRKGYAKSSSDQKTIYPDNLANSQFARWVYDSAVDGGAKNITISKAATILHEKAKIPYSTLVYVMSKGVDSPKTEAALLEYLKSKK